MARPAVPGVRAARGGRGKSPAPCGSPGIHAEVPAGDGASDGQGHRRHRLLPPSPAAGDERSGRGPAMSRHLHRGTSPRERDSPARAPALGTDHLHARHQARRGCALSPVRADGNRPELECLLLQSLLGIWPLDPAAQESTELRRRLEEYAVKAAREAKQQTSWLEPDAEYEEMLRQYVAVLLPVSRNTGFARYFRPVLDQVTWFGMLNGLSATVLKFTAPGVPDTYQGNELPAFVLVDPDNRRQPDLQAHAGILDGIARAVEATSLAATAEALLHSWQDGRLKLFITWRLLGVRSASPALFDSGSYLPLAVAGEQAAHLCAYARVAAECTLLVVVARWAATLVRGAIAAPLGHDDWGDTNITLPAEVPAGAYADVFTGRVLQPENSSGNLQLKAAALFETLPAAVLLRTGAGAQFEQQQ